MYKTELTSLQLGEGAFTFHVASPPPPPPFPAAPRKAWYKLEDTANRKADRGKVTKKKKSNSFSKLNSGCLGWKGKVNRKFQK